MSTLGVCPPFLQRRISFVPRASLFASLGMSPLSNMYGLLNAYCECSVRVHVPKLASGPPPYDRVPNISQYKFNNLFIIYVLHLFSSSIRTIYIRNKYIVSAYQPKNCFKFKIILCHSVSLYIFKPRPK